MFGNDALNVFADFRELWTEHGYEIRRQEFSAEHFGNALLELWSDRASWRLTRDRTQCFAEVSAATESKRWWDVRDVIAAAGLAGTATLDPKELAQACLRHLAAIESSLAADRLAVTSEAVNAILEHRRKGRGW